MEGHLVLCVDRLITPESLHSLPRSEDAESSVGRSCYQVICTSSVIDANHKEHPGVGGEEEPLLQNVECRICQEEDSVKTLEVPCRCSGSLKPYQPGYTLLHCLPNLKIQSLTLGWTVGGTQINLHDPRLLAMAAAKHRLLDANYDEYAHSNASGAAFCRSAA